MQFIGTYICISIAVYIFVPSIYMPICFRTSFESSGKNREKRKYISLTHNHESRAELRIFLHQMLFNLERKF